MVSRFINSVGTELYIRFVITRYFGLLITLPADITLPCSCSIKIGRPLFLIQMLGNQLEHGLG